MIKLKANGLERFSFCWRSASWLAANSSSSSVTSALWTKGHLYPFSANSSEESVKEHTLHLYFFVFRPTSYLLGDKDNFLLEVHDTDEGSPSIPVMSWKAGSTTPLHHFPESGNGELSVGHPAWVRAFPPSSSWDERKGWLLWSPPQLPLSPCSLGEASFDLVHQGQKSYLVPLPRVTHFRPEILSFRRKRWLAGTGDVTGGFTVGVEVATFSDVALAWWWPNNPRTRWNTAIPPSSFTSISSLLRNVIT